MKQRLRTILKVLSNADDYVTIDELAQSTGAGVRTVHRDLDNLERSLSYRDVRIERRRGYGVRLLDKLPENFARQVLLSASADQVQSGARRPMLMLIYLLIEDDWVKISQLALDFYISDSSVSSDLSALSETLPAGIVLKKQKGVGVKVEAEEAVLRKLFVDSLPMVFPPYEFDSIMFGDETSRNWMFRILDIKTSIALVEHAARNGFDILKMRFSPRHELLLHSYLLLLLRRCREERLYSSGENIGAGFDFTLDVPEPYTRAAECILTVLLASRGNESAGEPEVSESLAKLISRETDFLARILVSLEPSGSFEADSRDLIGLIYPQVKEIVERTLVKLEEQHRIWLHDDHGLIEYLRLVLSSAIHRLDFAFPVDIHIFDRHDHNIDSPVARILGDIAAELFGEVFPDFDQDRFILEAEEALLAFEARMERRRTRGRPVLKVKILCYEGLGMSNYLKIIAEKVLPPGTQIDTSWQRDISNADLEAGHFHMLISTFPVENMLIPHVLVSADADQDEIMRSIRGALDSARNRAETEPSGLSSQTETRKLSTDSISIAAIMSVLHNLTVRKMESGIDNIDQAVDVLGEVTTDPDQLKRDFQRREEYGSLIFEDYGVQLLHCRSSAVSEPRAAMLQAEGGGHSLLIIVAPAGSSSSESRVLSEIVITLSEDPDFPSVLSRGSREEIQNRLFRHFSKMMET